MVEVGRKEVESEKDEEVVMAKNEEEVELEKQVLLVGVGEAQFNAHCSSTCSC